MPKPKHTQKGFKRESDNKLLNTLTVVSMNNSTLKDYFVNVETFQ